MNFKSFIIVLIFSVGLSNCASEYKLDSADFFVRNIDGPDGRYDAFRSSENEFRWAVLGRPRLVYINESNSYLEFNSSGLFVFMDLSISNENRELLAVEARKIYSSQNIQKKQIFDLPLSKLNCRLESTDSCVKMSLSASIPMPQSQTPLSLFFFTKNEEKEMLKNDTNIDNLVLKCEIELNSQISTRFSLSVDKNLLFWSDSDSLFNEHEKKKLEYQRLKAEIAEMKNEINWKCSVGIKIDQSSKTINTSSEVSSLVLLNNGNLVSSTWDENIKIWNVEGDGQLLRTLSGHTDNIWSLVVLKNGYLASGSSDNTIKIWNVEGDSRLIQTLTGHTKLIESLLVLKNGYLASGSEDASIKIWDIENGQLVTTLTGHNMAIYALALLKNGYLASGSRDKTIKIWPILPKNL